MTGLFYFLRRTLPRLGQLATMAAIVATLLYWPLGLGIALFLALAGVPFDSFLTFGGLVHRYAGMLAWWLLVFGGAIVYAAFAFPWDHTRGFGPGPL